MTEKIALTVEEAADFTGIGRNTLVLIRTEDLDRFLELNRGINLRNQAEVHPLRQTN